MITMCKGETGQRTRSYLISALIKRKFACVSVMLWWGRSVYWGDFENDVDISNYEGAEQKAITLDRMYTQGSHTHNTFSQYHVLVPCLRCIIDDGIILAMMLTSVIIRGRFGGAVAGSPGMSPPDQHGGLS